MPVAAALLGTGLRGDGLGDMVCVRAISEFQPVLDQAIADYDAAVSSGVRATIDATYRTLEEARTVSEELVRACKHGSLL